jgi:hypothetical protein
MRSAPRPIELAPLLLALALGACNTESSRSVPHFKSAHFTAEERFLYPGVGHRKPLGFEAWVSGDRALIRTTARNGDTIRVLTIGDNEAYAWREGDSTGFKFISPTTDERKLDVPLLDYVFKAGACRKAGKKVTSGTYNGHPFVRYDCAEKSDRTTRIYNFATDLQGFPVHSTITYFDRTVVIYDGKSFEVPGTFPDSLFQVPGDVRFDDTPTGSQIGPPPVS